MKHPTVTSLRDQFATLGARPAVKATPIQPPHRCDQCGTIAFDPRPGIARYPDGFWHTVSFCDANCWAAAQPRAAAMGVTLEG